MSEKISIKTNPERVFGRIVFLKKSIRNLLDWFNGIGFQIKFFFRKSPEIADRFYTYDTKVAMSWLIVYSSLVYPCINDEWFTDGLQIDDMFSTHFAKRILKHI